VKFVGLQGGAIKFYNIEDIPRMADMTLSRILSTDTTGVDPSGAPK
jgi:hypothetical protein